MLFFSERVYKRERASGAPPPFSPFSPEERTLWKVLRDPELKKITLHVEFSLIGIYI